MPDLSKLRPELLSEATSKYVVSIREENNKSDQYEMKRYQVTYRFPNGYGVSVIQNLMKIDPYDWDEMSYGALSGLYEAALVIWDVEQVGGFSLCTDHLLPKDIDYDVHGRLTPEEVERLLLAAMALPTESPYTAEHYEMRRIERDSFRNRVIDEAQEHEEIQNGNE